jgi:hypothetical protein
VSDYFSALADSLDLNAIAADLEKNVMNRFDLSVETGLPVETPTQILQPPNGELNERDRSLSPPPRMEVIVDDEPLHTSMYDSANHSAEACRLYSQATF